MRRVSGEEDAAECGSHAIVGAVLGSCRTGERTLAADLAGAVGPGMLVLADAGLYSYELFNSFATTGADLAWRVRASVSLGHLRWLSDGSYLALIYTPGRNAGRRARLAEQQAKAGHDIPVAGRVRCPRYSSHANSQPEPATRRHPLDLGPSR
jgi:hypothetical protein